MTFAEGAKHFVKDSIHSGQFIFVTSELPEAGYEKGQKESLNVPTL